MKTNITRRGVAMRVPSFVKRIITAVHDSSELGNGGRKFLWRDKRTGCL